jgi:hypothetical protein
MIDVILLILALAVVGFSAIAVYDLSRDKK